MHLVGFSIEIYCDARPYELKINELFYEWYYKMCKGQSIDSKGAADIFVNLERMQGRKYGILLLIRAVQKWKKYCRDKIEFPLLLFFTWIDFNLPNLSDVGNYNCKPKQKIIWYCFA